MVLLIRCLIHSSLPVPSYLLLNLPAKPRFTLIERARVASTGCMLYLRTSADRLCIGICIHKGLVGILKMLVTFWCGSRLGLVCRANVFFCRAVNWILYFHVI
jgi:hypothetical protein